MSATSNPAIERLAERVAALLLPELTAELAQLLERTEPEQDELIDAAALARMLGVTRAHVYEHADELGAIRLGDGPRGRLRFCRAAALERLAREGEAPLPSARQVDDAVRRTTSAPLLPIRRTTSAPLLPIRGAGR